MTRCSETWWTVLASTSREHPWLLQQNEACVSGWWRIRNGRCNNEKMALVFFFKYCKCLIGLLFLVKHSGSERWCEAVTYSSCGRSSLLLGLRVVVCVVVRSFCRVMSCSCCYVIMFGFVNRWCDSQESVVWEPNYLLACIWSLSDFPSKFLPMAQVVCHILKANFHCELGRLRTKDNGWKRFIKREFSYFLCPEIYLP